MKTGDFVMLSPTPENKHYYEMYPKDLVAQVTDIFSVTPGNRTIIVAHYQHEGDNLKMTAYIQDVRVVDMVVGVEDLL